MPVLNRAEALEHVRDLIADALPPGSARLQILLAVSDYGHASAVEAIADFGRRVRGEPAGTGRMVPFFGRVS